jgi:hypothetical protein
MGSSKPLNTGTGLATTKTVSELTALPGGEVKGGAMRGWDQTWSRPRCV